MEGNKPRRTLRPKPIWLIQVRLCGPAVIIPGGKTKEVPSNPRKDTWQDILNRLGIQNVSSTQWEVEALRRSRNGPVRAGFDQKVESLIMHYGINLGYNRVHRIYLVKKAGVNANIGLSTSRNNIGREGTVVVNPVSSQMSHNQIEQEFANWLQRHYMCTQYGQKKVYIYQNQDDTYCRNTRGGAGEGIRPRPRSGLPPMPPLHPMPYVNQVYVPKGLLPFSPVAYNIH